jgi:hypothetical protein
MKSASYGQGYSSIVQVDFNSSDVFIYDAKGTVYYAKGFRARDKVYYSPDITVAVNGEPDGEEPGGEEEPINPLGVNAPVLGSGMKEVYWDASDVEISNGDASYNAANWYDYIAQSGTTASGGTSKWANATTADGSYWVWIPRFAYKINYYTDASMTTPSATKTLYGKIDVLFMQGTSTTKYINRATLTAEDLPSGYIVHPAFTNNISEGGWDSQISGFWMAKYQASHSDATSTIVGTSNIPISAPNLKMWGSATAKSAYNASLAYNSTLESHMAKNSEWGAVAYLAHSSYGRNTTEITVNNNEDMITGYGSNTISSGASGNTYPYDNMYGKRASTTGNLFGIYDMHGGLHELVSAYYSGGTPSTLTGNGGEMVYVDGTTTISTTGSKYATAYSGIDVNTDYKPGDATYETGGWNSDQATFYTAASPFLYRGGYYDNWSIAGQYYFYSCGGQTGDGRMSFRVCLIP